MDIYQIKCLLAVLDTENYSEAGEQLHISQSTVSKKIISLEKELGVKLIKKDGRHIALTSCGQGLIKNFMIINRNYEQIAKTVETYKRTDDSLRQSLRLIGLPVMHRYNVIAVASEFSKQNLDIEVVIDEIEADHVLLLLQKDFFDIAFCSDINLDAKRYASQHIAREKFMLAVPLSNPLSALKSVSLSDLKNEQFILNTYNSHLYDLCVTSCIDAGFSPNIFTTTNRPDIAFQYIHKNQDYVYMGLRRTLIEMPSKYHRVLTISDSPEFNFVFAWKRNRALPAIVKSFLEFAKSFK